MKFAFYGRVSTEDAQDPSLSLPRQLAACEHSVRQASGEITACYWDIESGRKKLSDRGQGADGGRFGVDLLRAGGLPELLDAKRLQAELGVTRAVAEKLMRQLPVVQFAGIRKVFVRRSDIERLIVERTFSNEQVPA